jgi:hypothetical protein
MDEVLLRANAEANEIFERMGQAVEARVNRGEQELNVLEVAREAGLEVDERHLNELHLPDTVPVNRIPSGITGFRFSLGGAGGGDSGIPGITAVHTGGTAAIGTLGKVTALSPNR